MWSPAWNRPAEWASSKALADILLAVPSKDTPRIQESHAVIYHILCELVEQGLFTRK
jgi:D-sedoheptulose 7-phosphate isomerase